LFNATLVPATWIFDGVHISTVPNTFLLMGHATHQRPREPAPHAAPEFGLDVYAGLHVQFKADDHGIGFTAQSRGST
jgi:hypothetical protein